jgi:hypothetical protein
VRIRVWVILRIRFIFIKRVSSFFVFDAFSGFCGTCKIISCFETVLG